MAPAAGQGSPPPTLDFPAPPSAAAGGEASPGLLLLLLPPRRLPQHKRRRSRSEAANMAAAFIFPQNHPLSPAAKWMPGMRRSRESWGRRGGKARAAAARARGGGRWEKSCGWQRSACSVRMVWRWLGWFDLEHEIYSLKKTICACVYKSCSPWCRPSACSDSRCLVRGLVQEPCTGPDTGDCPGHGKDENKDDYYHDLRQRVGPDTKSWPGVWARCCSCAARLARIPCTERCGTYGPGRQVGRA